MSPDALMGALFVGFVCSLFSSISEGGGELDSSSMISGPCTFGGLGSRESAAELPFSVIAALWFRWTTGFGRKSVGGKRRFLLPFLSREGRGESDLLGCTLWYLSSEKIFSSESVPAPVPPAYNKDVD